MSFLPPRPFNGVRLSCNFLKRRKPRAADDAAVPPVEDLGALPQHFADAANPRIAFRDGRVELDADGAANLDAQAAWLRAHPETGVILIASTTASFDDLARRRADAVRTALVLRGIAFDRIRLTLVENISGADGHGMGDMVLTEVSTTRSRREAPLMLDGVMMVEGTARPRTLPNGMTNRPRRMTPREIRPQRPTVDWARA